MRFLDYGDLRFRFGFRPSGPGRVLPNLMGSQRVRVVLPGHDGALSFGGEVVCSIPTTYVLQYWQGFWRDVILLTT